METRSIAAPRRIFFRPAFGLLGAHATPFVFALVLIAIWHFAVMIFGIVRPCEHAQDNARIEIVDITINKKSIRAITEALQGNNFRAIPATFHLSNPKMQAALGIDLDITIAV